jgi:hypothetical protein
VDVTQRARLARVFIGPAFIGILLALVGARGAYAADPTLYVHYAMNCTFTIIGDNGAAVTAVQPGRYQILITSPRPFAEIDLSGEPDPNVACGGSLSFRLTGPGVDVQTTLDDGDGAAEQFSATFQLGGTYVAQESRRPSARLVISVSSSAASTGGGSSGGSTGGTGGGTTTTKTTVPAGPGIFRGTLSGNVSTLGKLTLKFKGRTVSKLKSGRYTVSVLDEWSKQGFTLKRFGKPEVKLTGPGFVGRKAVTLTLGAGQWMFYSLATKKSYFIVTA